jgi:acetyl esterase/lipase
MPLSVDPELAAVLQARAEKLPPRPPRPAPGDWETRKKNSVYRYLMSQSVLTVPKFEDVTSKDYYATSDDGHQVLCRWLSKTGSSPGSAIIYMHGGGMINGAAEHVDDRLKQYVAECGVPFLNIDYRVAPEAQYPKPVQDVYAALVWLHEHAAELGVDPKRIAISGDSAGAGLAAAASLYARKKAGPAIAKQILYYPMLDDRTLTTSAALEPLLFVWHFEDNFTGWKAYFGDLFGTEKVPETAAPGRMVDAQGMPDLFLDVGDLDLFLAENLEYAAKHAKAGVSVEVVVRPGCPHGYDAVGVAAEVGRRSWVDKMRVFKSV